MNYGEYESGTGLGEDPMIFTGLIKTFLQAAILRYYATTGHYCDELYWLCRRECGQLR